VRANSSFRVLIGADAGVLHTDSGNVGFRNGTIPALPAGGKDPEAIK